MKRVEFTPEQQEMLKSSYIICNEKMIKIVKGRTDEVTSENLRLYAFDYNGDLYELTVEDFRYYDEDSGDFDYAYNEEKDYVECDETPEEVREIMDAAINARKGEVAE